MGMEVYRALAMLRGEVEERGYVWFHERSDVRYTHYYFHYYQLIIIFGAVFIPRCAY